MRNLLSLNNFDKINLTNIIILLLTIIVTLLVLYIIYYKSYSHKKVLTMKVLSTFKKVIRPHSLETKRISRKVSCLLQFLINFTVSLSNLPFCDVLTTSYKWPRQPGTGSQVILSSKIYSPISWPGDRITLVLDIYPEICIVSPHIIAKYVLLKSTFLSSLYVS